MRRKTLGIVLALLMIAGALSLVPPKAQACSTFSSPCYFEIQEDYCGRTSCQYCDTMLCCHRQSGPCIDPTQGVAFFQYCDQYCSAGPPPDTE